MKDDGAAWELCFDRLGEGYYQLRQLCMAQLTEDTTGILHQYDITRSSNGKPEDPSYLHFETQFNMSFINEDYTGCHKILSLLHDHVVEKEPDAIREVFEDEEQNVDDSS